MNSQRYLRIRDFLRAQLERLNGNMFALAKEIKAASTNKRGIDRRKLAALILTEEDVTLRISELESLDDYLSLHGKSLAYEPIFARPPILEMLASRRKVHFLVGVRIVDKNLSPSLFDTLAHKDILQYLNRERPGVATAFDVVLMGVHRREAHDPSPWPWEQALQGAEAVVTIGSPLSNPATHAMLLEMLGPYSLPSAFGGVQRPPFTLVVPKDLAAQAGSPFVQSPGNLDPKFARLAAKIRGRVWGLIVGDKLIVSDEEAEDVVSKPRLSHTYGVILAQRRATGHIWVVVAGLHGAGTHAAARALDEAKISLNPGPKGGDGPVHVRVVKAKVSTLSLDGTIISEVVSQHLLPEFENTSFDPPSAGDPSHKKAS